MSNDKEEELKQELDKASEAHHNALSNAPSGMEYHEFEAYMAKTGNTVERLSQEYRIIKTPTMGDIPIYGDHMKLEDFIECASDGSFIDYDGSGKYATATQESDISIYPSDVIAGRVRRDFTHVVWYNR